MVDEQDSGNKATEDKPQEQPQEQPKDKIAEKAPVLSLSIKDLKVLYSAYMPFLENGGLFIPTKKSFNMGDKLSLLISLMSEEKKYPVDCKIVWITPDKVHNNMAPGIGVQFTGPTAIELTNKIEQLLSPLSASTDRTNTM